MTKAERERQVVKCREHGLTFRTIGQLMNITPQRAQQIYSAATWPAMPLMDDGRPKRNRRRA